MRDKKCSDLLGGKNALKKLNSMAGKIFVSTSVPKVKGKGIGKYRVVGSSSFGNNVAVTVYSTWTPDKGKRTETNVGVYIDKNGQFFNGTGNLTIYSGSNTLVSAETRNVMTILHELMHWNGNRTNASGHNATFNQKIYDACIKNNLYYLTDPPQGPSSTSA